jgi:hypothetical protein
MIKLERKKMKKFLIFLLGAISGGYFIYKNREEVAKYIPQTVKNFSSSVYDSKVKPVFDKNVKPYSDQAIAYYSKTKEGIEEFTTEATDSINRLVIDYGPKVQEEVAKASKKLNETITKAIKDANSTKSAVK